MIPQAHIMEWSQQVPWQSNEQVEQDLVICRALVEIFSDEWLAGSLAFRGGTALHKLCLQPQLSCANLPKNGLSCEIGCCTLNLPHRLAKLRTKVVSMVEEEHFPLHKLIFNLKNYIFKSLCRRFDSAPMQSLVLWELPG